MPHGSSAESSTSPATLIDPMPICRSTPPIAGCVLGPSPQDPLYLPSFSHSVGSHRRDPIANLLSMLAQTATVLEGTVSSIDHTYDEKSGPWTQYIFSNLTHDLGTKVPGDKFVLRQLGGPLPSGKVMDVSDIPKFILGARYIAFLNNTTWNLAPLVGASLAFRVESLDGKPAIVSFDGFGLTDVTSEGFGYTVEPVADPSPDLARSPAENANGSGSALPKEASVLSVNELIERLHAEALMRNVEIAGSVLTTPSGPPPL
jgi:hypothetical protein